VAALAPGSDGHAVDVVDEAVVGGAADELHLGDAGGGVGEAVGVVVDADVGAGRVDDDVGWVVVRPHGEDAAGQRVRGDRQDGAFFQGFEVQAGAQSLRQESHDGSPCGDARNRRDVQGCYPYLLVPFSL